MRLLNKPETVDAIPLLTHRIVLCAISFKENGKVNNFYLLNIIIYTEYSCEIISCTITQNNLVQYFVL